MAEEHKVPAIERMMELLAHLEGEPAGMTVNGLVRAAGLPRSTVYRTLNTLEAHGVVRRDGEDGRYALGPRLLRLASRVPGDPRRADVTAAAMPHLRRLAVKLGETAKLTVLDGAEALCVAGARGEREFALNLAIGERYPLHAGAASKVLLAAQDPARRRRLLPPTLAARTADTIVDPAALEAELARVLELGWAEDRGEHAPHVRAFAAPVRAPPGEVAAAVSVAFLGGAPEGRQREIREEVAAAAAAITAELG